MEFITKLEEQKSEWDKIKHLGLYSAEERTRGFKAIAFGPVLLSIQASYYHYCTPRITMEPDGYSDMELAVIIEGIWTNLENHEVFNEFEHKALFAERNDTEGLYGYLDVSLIESLYQYLKRKYSKETIA